MAKNLETRKRKRDFWYGYRTFECGKSVKIGNLYSKIGDWQRFLRMRTDYSVTLLSLLWTDISKT